MTVCAVTLLRPCWRSLSRAGYRADDPDIARGLDWFVSHQQSSGLWNVGSNRPKDEHSDLWVALAVGRAVTRCSQNSTPGPSSP